MEARPLYETEATLSREEHLAFHIELKWKLTLHKLPIKYQIDYMATRDNKTHSFIELKCRTNASDAYSDYMLSLDKYDKGMDLSAYGLFILVVQWTDRIGYIQLDGREPFKVAMGGRTDRNDPQDLEPCMFIPMSEFSWMN